MDERFSRLPRSLQAKSTIVQLGPTRVPSLLAHPDGETPAPTVLWMHGRTVSKELDPGRYQRWLRAGIAACAIDLPGHGERLDASYHHPQHTLDTLHEVLPEIDHVLRALDGPGYELFDTSRLAIGGMSLGGMATLRRLCDEHPFACAAVESTTGSLHDLYFNSVRPWPATHEQGEVRPLDPMQNLDGWRPIPLLVLHSEADEVVPWPTQRVFLDALRQRYERAGADPGAIETLTWTMTGAPSEHAGFGRVANDAKNAQVEFLARHLRPGS